MTSVTFKPRSKSLFLESVPSLCAAMLFIGFVVDINTDQAVVVAIVFNVPIAVSGALLSRRLTIWATALSVLATVGAGWANAIDHDVTTGTVFNRALACLSFLIVGAMTLLFERSNEDIQELTHVEADTRREHDLRRFLVGLSGPLSPDELLQSAALGLRALLEADSVVLTAVVDERFAQPQWSAPLYTNVATPGKASGWLIDALPVTATPVITVRADDGTTSVGKWRCERGVPLYVVAKRPKVSAASELLSEALEGLEPLRERAIELDRLRTLAEGK